MARSTSAQSRRGTGMGREIAAIVMGALMPSMDTTIVAIGNEALMSAFGVGETAVQWVSTGYLLALAVAIPLVGWCEERFGGRRCWTAGLVLFLVGSAACAASPGLWALVACRVVQGFAAGALVTLLTSLPVEIARARGIVAVGGVMSTVMLPLSLGPILGPIFGGVVLALGTWHWLFLINVPVGLVAIALDRAWLGAASSTGQRAGRPFDLLGFALVALGTSALLLGFSEVGQGSGPLRAQVLVPLALGVALFAAFVALPATRDPARALVDVSLFRVRSVGAASASMFMAGATLYSAQFLLPLWLQRTFGADALTAALMLIPQGAGALVSRSLAGRLTDVYGGRVVALAGFALSAATALPFVAMGADVMELGLYAVLLVRGIATGMLIVPITTACFRGLPTESVPRATVIIRMFQQVGGSFGTAAVAMALPAGSAAFGPAILVMTLVSAVGVVTLLLFPRVRKERR